MSNLPLWTRFAAGFAGGIAGAALVNLAVTGGPVGAIYAFAGGVIAIVSVLALIVRYIGRRQEGEPRFSPGQWRSDGWHRIDTVADRNHRFVTRNPRQPYNGGAQ